MADINQLIEPITPSNTVNSINIYKVDYSDFWSASASYLPNVYVNPRKIKGNKFDDKYVNVNPKIGQLKIKQFVSSTLKSHWGLVSKAVKIKNTISLNTENDKYMFVIHASKEDLKKIKYDNYFGIRVSNTDLYDFDRRMIYHDIKRNPEDNNIVIIDRNNAEPMIDLSKYKNVFIDKNNFKPILRYYIDEYYEDGIPEFVGKQQDGVTGSMILPNNVNQGNERLSDNSGRLSDNSGRLSDNSGRLSDNNANQEEGEENQDNNSNSYTINEQILKYEAEKEQRALLREQSKVEKDLKKIIVRYVDKYVNFAAASELNNTEDIDYIVDAFNEYAQEENININQRSIEAVNRRVDKLNEIRNKLSEINKKLSDMSHISTNILI